MIAKNEPEHRLITRGKPGFIILPASSGTVQPPQVGLSPFQPDLSDYTDLLLCINFISFEGNVTVIRAN